MLTLARHLTPSFSSCVGCVRVRVRVRVFVCVRVFARVFVCVFVCVCARARARVCVVLRRRTAASRTQDTRVAMLATKAEV